MQKKAKSQAVGRMLENGFRYCIGKRTYADCAFIAFIYVIKRAKAFVVCTKRKIDGLSLKKQQENQKKR